MSFSQFFRILWARRFVVGIATLTCFVAAVTVGLVLPPRYSADARLMFDNFKPDPITGEVMSTQFARATSPPRSSSSRTSAPPGAWSTGWNGPPLPTRRRLSQERGGGADRLPRLAGRAGGGERQCGAGAEQHPGDQLRRDQRGGRASPGV
ncbi:Wzz/FepE/Etk N-terminal domain-containing protein [Sphingomonas sp. MMS24-JH45]